METVSGTVNGKPAITLYGNSGKPADYIFIGSDAAQKELSYSGVYLTYANTSALSESIFILNSSVAVARAELVTTGSKTTLTIDTAYGFSFGSKKYESN